MHGNQASEPEIGNVILSEQTLEDIQSIMKRNFKKNMESFVDKCRK